MSRKKVVGVSTGQKHTTVWTDAGELFTFGSEDYWKLGHGGTQHESVPRLVEALAGKKAIGAAGYPHGCVDRYSTSPSDRGNFRMKKGQQITWGTGRVAIAW